MVTYGIDISNHQGDFPVAGARAEGYEFCWAKCSQGNWYEDPYFFSNVSKSRECGMLPGAYHWLEYGNGVAQARMFFNRCQQAGMDQGLLIACDNESNADWATTVAFFNEWNRLSGGHPMYMYSGAWWWQPRGWNGASLTPLLWHSRYVSGSGTGAALYGLTNDSFWTPYYGGWGQATVLQYSSSGVVQGRAIDVNVFRGSIGELRATAGGSGVSVLDQQERECLFGAFEYVSAMGGNVDHTWNKDIPAVRTLLTAAADAAAAKNAVAVLPSLQSTLSSVKATVEAIDPTGTAEFTEPQMLALRAEVRSAVNDWLGGVQTNLANEVAGLLAPQFRQLGQIAQQLGALGDFMGQTMGTLNDPQ